MKNRGSKSEKRRVLEDSRVEKSKRQKKEETHAQNVREVAKQCVFSMICMLGESKSRLAKAVGAEPFG